MMESWTILLSELPTLQAGELIKAMCEYQLTGEKPETDPIIGAILSTIIPVMDENNQKHTEKCARLARNASKSEPKREQIETEMQTNRDRNEIKSEGESESESESEIKEKEASPKGEAKKESAQRFKKPTVEEVAAYCRERGNGIEAQTFWDFYEGVGWKVGQKPMKDWKACIRTWEQRRKERTRSGTQNRFSTGMIQSDYSGLREEDLCANYHTGG